MKKMFYGVEEVAELMGTSKSTAYTLIAELNKELKKQGKFCIQGRINKDFLLDNIYVSANHKENIKEERKYLSSTIS